MILIRFSGGVRRSFDFLRSFMRGAYRFGENDARCALLTAYDHPAAECSEAYSQAAQNLAEPRVSRVAYGQI